MFSQNADDMAGGAFEVNNIPMAECRAYGALGTHQAENIPVSHCLAYRVFEAGKEMREGEDDAYENVEGVYT